MGLLEEEEQYLQKDSSQPVNSRPPFPPLHLNLIFFLCAGWLCEDGSLATDVIALHETICSLRRWNSGMRGQKQSDPMTQQHLERELFLLSFKEWEGEADKALLTTPLCTHLEASTPAPAQSLWTSVVLRSLYSRHTHVYIWMSIYMHGSGRMRMSSVHRDALKRCRSCHERARQLELLQKGLCHWHSITQLRVLWTCMFGSDSNCRAGWPLFKANLLCAPPHPPHTHLLHCKERHK